MDDFRFVSEAEAEKDVDAHPGKGVWKNGFESPWTPVAGQWAFHGPWEKMVYIQSIDPESGPLVVIVGLNESRGGHIDLNASMLQKQYCQAKDLYPLVFRARFKIVETEKEKKEIKKMPIPEKKEIKKMPIPDMIARNTLEVGKYETYVYTFRFAHGGIYGEWLEDHEHAGPAGYGTIEITDGELTRVTMGPVKHGHFGTWLALRDFGEFIEYLLESHNMEDQSER